MSHHFDSEIARGNPTLNICDTYMFPAGSGRTAMAMTVTADVGMSTPDVLPDEALYAFRIDTQGEGREEIAFTFRFGDAHHVDGDGHRHAQAFTVRRAVGDGIGGEQGEVLARGETGTVVEQNGVRAYAGVAPELWAADAIAFFNFLEGLHKEERFASEAFEHRTNFFRNRNVMVLVLEVPNEMIGEGRVWLWSTSSLFGHAPEMQVYRWGLPLFTHFYMSDPATNQDLVAKFHQSEPWQDREQMAPAVEAFVAKLATAGGIADPAAHAAAVTERLIPCMLPYEMGTPARFDLEVFNGRPLGTDGYDVMLSLGAGRPIADGVAPPQDRIIDRFPYYGRPYSRTEQADLAPMNSGFEA
jgi:hypothetical protein